MFWIVLRFAPTLAVALVLGLGSAWAGQTFDKVKQAGQVVCGVNTGLPVSASPTARAAIPGLMSISARRSRLAVFGDADKVKYVPLTAQQRFTALQSGEIDVLSRNTTCTLQRDTELGLNFTPVVFYDGQGFMVHEEARDQKRQGAERRDGLRSARHDDRANLADYFRANKMQFEPVVIEKLDEVDAAYLLRPLRRDTTDRLGARRDPHRARAEPRRHVILPEVISKEPLAPAVRQGDDQWDDIVRWVVYALIEAEEKGITSKNLDDKTESRRPRDSTDARRTPGLGKALGVDEKWAYNAIKSVGNYGEIFERNVGEGSPLKLDRGPNNLWTRGGLMYAMPIR